MFLSANKNLKIIKKYRIKEWYDIKNEYNNLTESRNNKSNTGFASSGVPCKHRLFCIYTGYVVFDSFVLRKQPEHYKTDTLFAQKINENKKRTKNNNTKSTVLTLLIKNITFRLAKTRCETQIKILFSTIHFWGYKQKNTIGVYY